MNPRNQLQRLQKKLTGLKVTFRRLVGNSLIIYLGCEPGNKEGYVIWFEPCWNFCGPSKVLAGSCQSELAVGPYQAEGFKKIAPLLDKLIGRKIVSVQVEPRSNHLKVLFIGGYQLTTFIDDPEKNESWHITDNGSELVIYASPSGIEIRKNKKRENRIPVDRMRH
ncbi:MAG: hypothetical protein HY595_02310 [Candidatus Omnitrophica bacterium]|nr:hypothetical protein [Candidatus Omnitrophota bacterium]